MRYTATIALGTLATLAAPRAPRPTGCASVAALQRAWRGTGEWRALAPFPVARDASPTDSVGVWLERWRYDDGRVELRRVSAGETVVAAADAGCDTRLTVRRRTFDSAATAGTFTDDRLRDLLRHHPRGMVYVWTPRMPLSVAGLDEARAAARASGIAFTAVAADSLEALELVYRNATIHFPAAILYADGRVLGAAIPGYKDRDTYAALAREYLARPDATPVAPPNGPSDPALWLDRKARVTTLRSVATPREMGFFFKPVAGTDLISYTSNNRAYLFDLRTGADQRIPGHVDPVPTPDGRFVTRPGLLWHPVHALIAGDTASVYEDPDLPDEYQSISVLARSRSTVRYRVVTGWRVGLRVRAYDVDLARDGRPTAVRPAGEAAVPCPERRLVLPISAKGTREVGAHDMRAETTRLIEVRDDGTCVDRMDLGFASGKVAFSYDASAIAFATSRIDVDASGALLKPSEMFYKDAFALYRKSGRLVPLSSNRGLRASTFPEFLPDGKILLLDQASSLRAEEVIRTVVVR